MSRPTRSPAEDEPAAYRPPARAWTAAGASPVPTIVAVLVGVGVTAAFFYPGYLSGDSNWQYGEALLGEYSDWHPPVMAFLWRQLDRVIEGSGGMFLLIGVVFWTGLALHVRSFSRGPASFFLPLAFLGLYTPVFSMLSQVGKDTFLGASLLLGFAALVRADRRRSLAWLAAACIPLWLAVALRHNAAAAVGPLALWLGWLAARDHAPGVWQSRLASPARRLGLGLAIFVALYAAKSASTSLLLAGSPPSNLYQLILTYDLAGISVRSGNLVLPPLFADEAGGFDLAEVEALYHPQSNFWLHWPPDEGVRRLPLVAEGDLPALRAAWAREVAAHPGAYASHRGALLLAQLGLLPDSPIHGVHFNVEDDYLYRGPSVFGAPHNRWVTEVLWQDRASIVFRPWLYLLLTALCVAFAWRTRSVHRVPIGLAALSSASYFAPYLGVGVAADYRYVWWPVLVGLISVVMVLDGLGATDPDVPQST